MSHKIKKGDVVCLKSGGPEMTVEKIEQKTEGEAAHCSWFSRNTRQTEYFDIETLKLVGKKTKGS